MSGCRFLYARPFLISGNSLYRSSGRTIVLSHLSKSYKKVAWFDNFVEIFLLKGITDLPQDLEGDLPRFHA